MPRRAPCPIAGTPASGPTARRFTRVVRALLLLILCYRAPAQATETSLLELAVKATYLYKLGAFVHWARPNAEFPAGAFAICVIGRDPFGGVLERVIANQTIDNHPVVLRRFATISNDPGCSVAYLAGSPAQSVAGMLDALRNASVLTVTDGALDPEAKGIVHLMLRDGRVRFAIDDQAAAEHGLMVSSKLLALAVAVRPRSARR